MAGYKHPCLYCGKFISFDSNVCPVCGSKDPFVLRCPKCRNPIEKDWIRCSHCGISLQLKCPHCGQTSFIGDKCDHCSGSLLIVCPNKKCGYEQLLLSDRCVKCKKSLKKGESKRWH